MADDNSLISYCRWWECLDPDVEGPAVFVCECGRMSGGYRDAATGEAALDRHLAAEERAEVARRYREHNV